MLFALGINMSSKKFRTDREKRTKGEGEHGENKEEKNEKKSEEGKEKEEKKRENETKDQKIIRLEREIIMHRERREREIAVLKEEIKKEKDQDERVKLRKLVKNSPSTPTLHVGVPMFVLQRLITLFLSQKARARLAQTCKYYSEYFSFGLISETRLELSRGFIQSTRLRISSKHTKQILPIVCNRMSNLTTLGLKYVDPDEKGIVYLPLKEQLNELDTLPTRIETCRFSTVYVLWVSDLFRFVQRCCRSLKRLQATIQYSKKDEKTCESIITTLNISFPELRHFEMRNVHTYTGPDSKFNQARYDLFGQFWKLMPKLTNLVLSELNSYIDESKYVVQAIRNGHLQSLRELTLAYQDCQTQLDLSEFKNLTTVTIYEDEDQENYAGRFTDDRYIFPASLERVCINNAVTVPSDMFVKTPLLKHFELNCMSNDNGNSVELPSPFDMQIWCPLLETLIIRTKRHAIKDRFFVVPIKEWITKMANTTRILPKLQLLVVQQDPTHWHDDDDEFDDYEEFEPCICGKLLVNTKMFETFRKIKNTRPHLHFIISLHQAELDTHHNPEIIDVLNPIKFTCSMGSFPSYAPVDHHCTLRMAWNDWDAKETLD